MEREPDRHHHEKDAAELEAALRRLGIRELEERLELSPLPLVPGLEPTDRCECSCSCDDVPDEVPFPDNPPSLDHSGTGIYLGPR